MNVKIEGKEHREGKSKAGRDYNFHVIHFLAPRSGVVGNASYEKIVSSSVIDFDAIIVGQVYDLTVDFSGNIVSMVSAKA